MAGLFLHPRAGAVPDMAGFRMRMPQNRRRTPAPWVDASGWIQAGRKALEQTGTDKKAWHGRRWTCHAGHGINDRQTEGQRQAGRKFRTFRRR